MCDPWQPGTTPIFGSLKDITCKILDLALDDKILLINENGMKSTDLRPGMIYDIPTVHSDNANYFTVRTEDGVECNIKKLKFQQTEPVPPTLSCLVKSMYNGQPLLLQDLTPYINRFYEEGKQYAFRVRADYTRNHFYEVEDTNGLYFRLPATDVALSVGQTVTCEVVRKSGCVVRLRQVSSAMEIKDIPLWTLENIKEKVFRNHELPFWIRRFIRSEKSKDFHDQYNQKNARWLINAIRYFIDQIPSWFNDTATTNYDLVQEHLKDLLHTTRVLLEGSDYLVKCSDNERQTYRKQLSDMATTITLFLRACNMLQDGDYKDFIDRMFGNLKLSGYLYHPDKQFQIFNTILRIHPQFIHEWMGHIFDALTSWDVQNWKAEPFRSAFVRQTELYIRENQHVVDELVNFNNKENNAVISKMIMALAIQMLIIDGDKDDVNIDRNRAMFYRYISYLNNVAQQTLLEKAFRCVMGCQFKPEFKWEHLRQLEMLITLSGVDNNATILENTLKVYSSGSNCLEISAQRIQLRHGIFKSGSPLLPNGLLKWQNLQIYADDCEKVKVPSAAKRKDLNAYKVMWACIDDVLFPQRPLSVKRFKKIKAAPGDEVSIRVDEVRHVAEGKTVCSCTVVDEAYEGSGLLNVRNIARYSCSPTIDDFYDDETHNKMIFRAQVQGVNADGRLAFNMLQFVDDSIREYVSYGAESDCVITSKMEATFMCLSENGYSVVVPRDETTEAYDTGSSVRVMVTEVASGAKILGYIKGDASGAGNLTSKVAFHNLLQNIYIDVEEEQEEEENVIQAEEAITYEQVDELISIIRRLAFSSADYVQAYNYLGFARVLAKLVSDEKMVDICAEHMELLILLQSFAKDHRVDFDVVERHADRAQCNPMLSLLYTRLLIISNIGRPEYNQRLWEMLGTASSEEDANLIRKVLTLNLMKESGDLDRSLQNKVLEQIGNILNVNFYQSTLKFYGTESQYVEFKTSIVYPADNHMKPDENKQYYEIASVICGFLNADGGTLYIGVNDQGYESGVANDMQYYKVSMMDKYILKIENLIQTELGSTANDYITIAADTDCKNNVAVVKILPSLRVIRMERDGKVYVRHTTSTRPKTGLDLEIFEKDRKILYQQKVDAGKGA